jgi:hypothetical protein
MARRLYLRREVCFLKGTTFLFLYGEGVALLEDYKNFQFTNVCSFVTLIVFIK